MRKKRIDPKLILICLVVLLLVRGYVSLKIPQAQVLVESQGYMLIAKNVPVFQSLTGVLHPAHTPGYPFVLAMAGVMRGFQTKDSINGLYYNEDYGAIVSLLQSAGVILGTILLIVTLYKLGFSKIFYFTSAILMLTLLQMIVPEKMVVSESLSMVWIMGITAIGGYILKTRSKLNGLVITLLLMMGILGWIIRPTYLYLIPIISFSLILLRPKKQIIIVLVSCSIVTFLSSILYSHYITKTTGYHGITYISDVSYMGKVLQYNLPLPAEYPKNEELLKKLHVYTQVPQFSSNIFSFINNDYPEVYQNYILYEDIGSLGRLVILQNVRLFLKKTILNAPSIIFPYPDNFTIQSLFLTDPIGRTLYILSYIFKVCMILLYILAPISFVEGIFSKDTKKKFLSFISSIILFNAFFLILFAYSDVDRYWIPFIPLVIILILFWIHRLLHIVSSYLPGRATEETVSTSYGNSSLM